VYEVLVHSASSGAKLSHLDLVLLVFTYYGKLRRIGWVGHVVRMGELKNAYKILVKNLEENRQLTA
jgi:hypothetical protein